MQRKITNEEQKKVRCPNCGSKLAWKTENGGGCVQCGHVWSN